MIGPIFALLLGGAQGVPPAQEGWNAATMRLAPGRILPAEAVEAWPGLVAGSLAKEAEAAARPGQPDPDAELMPLRLERAVIRPLDRPKE